jgi:NADPH:quinone reductase-like Zn-dependent oxidoreductase
MKAMAVSGYGPLERLHAVEVPEGAPGAGEVLVHVVASALNPADYEVIGGTTGSRSAVPVYYLDSGDRYLHDEEKTQPGQRVQRG